INNLYEFAEFKFDGKKGKLWKNEELILLSPKATELLALLLERNGKFVSKEEIFEKVWAGTYVEDGVLTQNIYTLRKALGNDADGSPIIENKTRLGYRVTIPINEIEQTTGNQIEITNAPQSDTPSILVEKKSQNRKPITLILGSILLLVTLFLGWFFLRAKISAFFRKPIENVKFTKLSNSGDLANAVLSPDGNLVAFIRGNDVYLKDIATDKDIKLTIPNVPSFSSLRFSPDGNFIYFRNNKIPNTLAKILKVSRFGGETTSIAENSWGMFSVSPDGKKIAYFQNRVATGVFLLKILYLESNEEKEFPIFEAPNALCLSCSPAWSPDGQKLIYTITNPNSFNQLFLLNLANENISEIKLDKLRRFEQAAWMPDGESFLVSASDGNRFLHLWKVFYPNLDMQPMTNGLLSYSRISISANGKKILALQTNENSNLFVANAENLNEQKQLTFGNQNNVGQTALNWIDNQKIVYSTQTEDNPAENLSIIDTIDSSKAQLSTETEISYRFPTSDSRFIYFHATKNGFSNIFQMTTDGKNLKQLTNESDGQRQSPRVTNDGRYVYYTFRGRDASNIRRYDLQNQKEEIFFSHPEYPVSPFMELSPDNKYITFFAMTGLRRGVLNLYKYNAIMVIVSTQNTADIKWFLVSIIPPIRRFSPDSQSIEYILADTDGTQIVRQSFDGSDPKPIYTIPDGRIFNFAWSKDGRKLAISRGQQLRDAILLSFDK
ncbi:MAG TPA: winged helix-turn-helix domain-containing protein, partial [Pyrinomonadaceae bacterium]|nr:winged helix-turn-helix domain-containing protein [Pyrinomonadaceae bacterium]